MTLAAAGARAGAAGPRDDASSATDPIPILKALTSLRQVTALYPRGHTIVQQAAATLYDLVTPNLEGREILRLDVIEGDVHVDGEPCRLESAANGPIVGDFLDMGVDSVHFARGVDRQELQTAAEVLLKLKDRSLGMPVTHRLQQRDEL